MVARWICLSTLVLLMLSVSACTGDAKSEIVGKWEATITHKKSGNEAKFLWEFLPDGTFAAAPLQDPGTILDKDKYQIIDGGQMVKFRSQLAGDVICTSNGSTMTGENSESIIKFKKL
jgi:hypothetical protein